jgi:hypothetical protein
MVLHQLARFTEYVVMAMIQHHVNRTASEFVSPEDVDWWMMIPATIHTTKSNAIQVSFHE